tara:strand:- start:27 stop:572 length:546 start_codon:yes stop_codon:yes gene_type:complete
MKITKTQLKQIIMEELEEVRQTGESVMVGYPGELKLYNYLEKMLGEKLAVELTSAVRLTDEDTQEYILKLANEMIVSEGATMHQGYGSTIAKGGINVPEPKAKKLLDLVDSLLPKDLEERKDILGRILRMEDYSQQSLDEELAVALERGDKKSALDAIYKWYGISRDFAHKMSSGGYGRLD